MKKFFLSYLIILITASFFYSQEVNDLPNKIRGYKVHRAKVSVQQNSQVQEKDADVSLNFGEPKLLDFSLTEVNLSMDTEFTSFSQTGNIDFLVFRDFKVNGLKVSLAEYQNSFELIKNKPVKLPKPLKISVKFSQTLKGLFQEWKNSDEEWQITGIVFIFGKFKKSFFTFKRVVPIEINLKIKNPLKKMI